MGGGPTDAWIDELRANKLEVAWDLFLERYRRLVFAAIRHYAQDYDDVMDVFARVCDALRTDDMRRLRSYVDQPSHRARFSTWLVTVVRHLTVDWFRHRDGRRRLSTVAAALPAVQRRIFEYVFLEQRSHIEAYELIRARDASALSFNEFLAELRATYRAVTDGRRGRVLQDLGPKVAEREDVSNVPSLLPQASSAADAAEQSRIVEEALGSLAPEDRLAVELYVVEDLPAEAVAKVLGLTSPKAAYNRVYRALAALRERLERAGVRREDV